MSLFKAKEFCSLHHRSQNIMIKNTYSIKTTSVYGELDSLIEHRTQFAFKGKRQHTSKLIDIGIPYGSSNHVIVPDTVKVTFNFDIESTDQARSIVNNVGKALIKKKTLKLGSTNIDSIDKSDVYDTYKDLYLSEKEGEERLLQGMQSVNGLKARVGAKKADGRKMQLKRRLIKGFQYR